MLVYPILCKFLQTYPGITQDNLVADAARRVPVRRAPVIMSVPVPAAILISCTPSPSLRQSGDLPTRVAAGRRAPLIQVLKLPGPARPFAAHAYKARNGVHWPA